MKQIKIRNKRTGEIRYVFENDLINFKLGGQVNKIGVKNSLWSNTYLSKKQIGGQYIPVNTELPYNQYMEANIPMPGVDLADMRGVKTNREGQFENLSNREYKKISKSISEPTSKDLFKYQVGGNKIVAIKNPLKKYVG